MSNQGKEQESRLWAMILHLSIFSGFIVPLAGFIAPIVIWQVKKDELPNLDAHGKVVVNWIISAFIYAVVGIVLSFVLVGIPLLLVLGILQIVFPIIGGIKASKGELWKYPLSLKLVK